ncbi:hypothetical protein CB1_002578022 [Camelus ferus]|nr:hypothetical protein CB1_002578022 [Camelus ferus]
MTPEQEASQERVGCDDPGRAHNPEQRKHTSLRISGRHVGGSSVLQLVYETSTVVICPRLCCDSWHQLLLASWSPLDPASGTALLPWLRVLPSERVEASAPGLAST